MIIGELVGALLKSALIGLIMAVIQYGHYWPWLLAPLAILSVIILLKK